MKRQPTNSESIHRSPDTRDDTRHDDARLTDDILADLLASDDILPDTAKAHRAEELADLREVIDQVRDVQPRPGREPDWDRMAATIGRACDDAAGEPPGWRAALHRWLETWLCPRYAVPAVCCAVAIIALLLVSRGDDPETAGNPLPEPRDDGALVLDLTTDDRDETSWPLLDNELPLLDEIDDETLDELTAGLAAEFTPDSIDDLDDPEIGDTPESPSPESPSPESLAGAARDRILTPELAVEWADLGNDLAAADELPAADPDEYSPNFDDLDGQELDAWLDGLSEEELDEIDAALAG